MELLVQRGADVDAPVSREDIHPKGWRALFATITHEKVEAFRSLIRMGANPNVVQGDDNTTPLMMACEFSFVMVRELLKAGADPTMTDARGKTALHVAGSCKYATESIRLLTAKAPPETLMNRLDNQGNTALNYAARFGQEAAVSRLLSVGANDQGMLQRLGDTSLCTAVITGQEGVVRIMISSKSNLDAVGGRLILPRAMCLATFEDRARILHLLLNVEGEGRRQFWARQVPRFAGDKRNVPALRVASIEGLSSLHRAASHGAFRSVRLLLAAGADEMARDPLGHRASDGLGATMPPGAKDPGMKCAAVARELRRAPAFRARSWTWPARVECGEGGAGGNHASGDTAMVLASPVPTYRAPLGVRIFRPRRCSTWCVRLFPRYSLR
eukprot:g7429.t1